MLNQIKGALFGLAIGDALGGTTEFLTKEEVKRKYGKLTEIIGGGVWDLEKGETTDDTAMTLAVARGIINEPHDPVQNIGQEFLKWYDSDPKDIGNIIRMVFETFEGDWFVAAERAHRHYLDKKTAGNGSLMRCLPVALAYRDYHQMIEITRLQSKMTHYDPTADEACVIYNSIAYDVLNGEDLLESIQNRVDGTIYEEDLNGSKPTVNPDGYVVNTMKWVLYWLLNGKDFTEVIVGAANEGYDTDTVAAIAGGLAGLNAGYDALPKTYCDVLLNKDEIVYVANELVQLRENKSNVDED